MLCSLQIREVAALQISLEDIVPLTASQRAKVEESIAPYKFDSDTKRLFLRAVAIFEIEYFNDDRLMREIYSRADEQRPPQIARTHHQIV